MASWKRNIRMTRVVASALGSCTAFGLAYAVLRPNLLHLENKKEQSPVAREKSSFDKATAAKPPPPIRNDFKRAIKAADEMMRRFKEEKGVPGMAVGVLVNGRTIWKTGYGYSDVENLTPCTGDTVMRIGSISKSITMTLVAKLMQENKLDLDAPIQKYVPSFPEKQVNGEKVGITTRHLVSHMASIRHYEKPNKTPSVPLVEQKHSASTTTGSTQSLTKRDVSQDATASPEKFCEKCKAAIASEKKAEPKSEFQYVEYYNQKQYNSVTDALSLFKDDPLVSKPGTSFKYTTHGWTLVSAVVEGANGKGSFQDSLKDLFSQFGMRRTYLDENYPLIPDRSQYYRRMRSHHHRLENVPSVNNSYKWAGGGLVSNVGDLLRFADALLFFYNHCPGTVGAGNSACYLNKKTLSQIWTPYDANGADTAVNWASKNGRYAMGWAVTPDLRLRRETEDFYVCHTGGSVGACCVLLMKPNANIAVVVLTNLQECGGLYELARAVADNFEEHSAA